MRNVRYVFTLSRPLNPVEREYMLRIPGVRQKEDEPFLLRAPYNARDVVQWHLAQIQGLSVVRIDNDLKWVPKDVNLGTLLVPPEQVPELKPGIKVKDFQREALAFGQQAMGSIMDLPTGAGKTLLGILYALSRRRPDGTPMRALVVTRSKVVDQWGSQVDHFFRGVKWLALHSQSGYEVRPSSEEQLLSGCLPYHIVAVDTPKVKDVVGWYRTQKEAKDATVSFANTPLRIPADVSLLILGWDILKYRLQALLSWGPRVFVVDEAHAAKNHHRWVPGAYDAEGKVSSWKGTDNRSSATAQLSRVVAHVLELTATPAPHLPSDIWALADLADPFGYGSWRVCGTRYFDGQDKVGVGYSGFTATGVSNVSEWAWRRQYLVFHVPQERVDAEMPKLYRNIIRVPIDRQDSSSVAQAELTAAKKQGAASLLEMQLYLASVAKRSVIREMVEEWFGEQRKCIIFYGRKKAADRQAKLLETVAKHYNSLKEKERDENGYVQRVDRKVQAEVFLVHGDTPKEDAKTLLAAYIAHPGPCVLITTTDALGEAIDGMQKGTTRVIVAQLPWTFGRIRQMEGRTKRLEADERTMREGVTYYYLIAEGLIDELIYQRVIRYIEMGSELLDDEALRTLSRELSGSESPEDLTNSLAARLLRAYDEDASDVDELRFDFSPEGARLRSAGESPETHGSVSDEGVDIDSLIDAYESNADG